MKSPVGWVWPSVAALASLTAILARSNEWVSVPVAALAVVAAGVVLAGALRAAPRRPDAAASRDAGPSVGIREMFRAGGLGREDLILTLDRIERKTAHPGLPARPPQELARLVRLSDPEFERYLEARVATLEGTL